MLDSKGIGERIKLSREQAGMSLNDVAQKVGLDKSSILRYENGEIAKAKAQIIEKVAAAVNVSPHYLLGWTDNPSIVNADEPMVDGESMSRNEKDLVRSFRKMDLQGQASVINTIMDELKRIQKEDKE